MNQEDVDKLESHDDLEELYKPNTFIGIAILVVLSPIWIPLTLWNFFRIFLIPYVINLFRKGS